jgi:hypothetical protein
MGASAPFSLENIMISKKDLERGYSNTGAIPEVGDNVHNPESVKREEEEKKWRKKYDLEEEPGFGEGGFLDRNENCWY